MTEQELNRRLKQALDAAAPDDLDGVLSRCAPREETVVPLRPKRRSHTRALIGRLDRYQVHRDRRRSG